MASSSSSNSWILSVKLLLTTVAVVSVAVTVKLAVPLMLTGLPAVWSVVATWLKPPYLYVVINGIIITIAASTRFQHNHLRENQPEREVSYTAPDVNAPPSSDLRSDVHPVEIPASFGVMEPLPVSYGGDASGTVEPPVVYESKLVAVAGEDEFVTSRSTWNSSEKRNKSPPAMKLIQPEFNFPVKEKQLVTSRFATNRKPAKATPEGARALRVLKPKKHETLETTWKMITDGRQLPLTRHLRKSDTFDNLHHQPPSSESPPATKPKAVRKSETFNDRTTYANQNDYPQPPATLNSPAPAPVGKLKKDGSLSQDELNRRVEAFIKKFNDDMRLQRQESLKHYMEMVKSGAR